MSLQKYVKINLCSSLCQGRATWLTEFSTDELCVCKRESSTYWQRLLVYGVQVELTVHYPFLRSGFRDLEGEHLQENRHPSTLKSLSSENIFSDFHLDFFVYRNIISNGLSQHNKYMERRGITWLYRFQRQKVILRTTNLYIPENLKCQSS